MILKISFYEVLSARRDLVAFSQYSSLYDQLNILLKFQNIAESLMKEKGRIYISSSRSTQYRNHDFNLFPEIHTFRSLEFEK